VPLIEKQRGDEFLKKEDFDSALRHYSKVIIAIKVLREDKSLSPESIDLDKIIRTYGVIIYQKIKIHLFMLLKMNKTKDLLHNDFLFLQNRLISEYYLFIVKMNSI